MSLKTRFALKAITAAMVLSASAAAQAAVTPEQIGLTSEQVRAAINNSARPKIGTGTVFGSPAGFGLDWGAVGVGVAATYNSHIDKEGDGSAVIAMGFGDAQKAVGLEVGIAFLSLLTQSGKSKAFEQGSAGLKLHTQLGDRSGVAFGVENIARFGDEAKKGRTSVYAVGTRFFDALPNTKYSFPIGVNLGFGNNRFARLDETDRRSESNVFGGLSFGFTPRAGLAVDWTGQDLNAAVSLVPFRRLPMSVELGGVNLTGQEGNRAAFAASTSYLFSF